MSRTSTISSCSASKTVVSTSSGSCLSPANCSAYIRATLDGVSMSPSRSGSSPTARSISRAARSIRSWSTGFFAGRSRSTCGWSNVDCSAAGSSFIALPLVVYLAVAPVSEHLAVRRAGEAVKPRPGTRRQGKLLRRHDRRPVGRQALAVARVGATDGALLHGGEDFKHLLAGTRLVLKELGV